MNVVPFDRDVRSTAAELRALADAVEQGTIRSLAYASVAQDSTITTYAAFLPGTLGNESLVLGGACDRIRTRLAETYWGGPR